LMRLAGASSLWFAMAVMAFAAALSSTPNKKQNQQKIAPLTGADMERGVLDAGNIEAKQAGAEPVPIDFEQPHHEVKANVNYVQEVKLLSDIVIAIPTMRRWTKSHEPAPEQYLKPLVTTLRDQMTTEQQSHVSFLLMNVDKQPYEHKELLELQSLPGVRVITKDPSAGVTSSADRTWLDDGREVSKQAYDWVTGETHDVPTLLLQASSIAPYVIFLEDDVTPTTNAISKIYQFLEEMKNEGKQNFFMVDLYTPAISWGPQTAMNKERYSYECCTQAMLFNSHRIREICDFELNHPGKPVDDNIRDFVRENPEARAVFAMVPNPFEHVGRYSSNPEKSTGELEHRSLKFDP